MKWLLGLLVVVVVLSPALVFGCPPPAAPDYTGPDIGSGPAPSDPASGGSGDGGGDGVEGDDTISTPDIVRDDFTL